jgi:hypothetical protein
MPELALSTEVNLFPARPVENRLINILVSNVIALDGSVFNGQVDFFYTTSFNPFYSSATRVRLIAGQFLSDVPDDAINQLIWFYSKEADHKNLSPCAAEEYPARYKSYRMRWVTAAVVVTLISGTSINARMQKRLGDLSVLRDGAAKELLGNMHRELEKLGEILEDGGKWGRRMEVAVKADLHPDRPVIGRLWANEDGYDISPIPGANSRGTFRRGDGQVQRAPKKTFKDRSGPGFSNRGGF